MGFRFRKSKKIGPFRVNFSKKGVGWSVGNKWFRYTKKAGGGTRTTTSVPGTGLSFVKDYGKSHAKRNHKNAKPVSETSVIPSSDVPTPNRQKKGTALGCLMWLLTIFLLLCFLGFFPSLTSVLCLLVALLILPVERWQNFLSRYIPSENNVRGWTAAGLFFLALVFYGIPFTAPAGVAETPSPTPNLEAAMEEGASPTPSPVASTSPTPTPSQAPTPTPTLQPTATPSPTPTATPTPEPTAATTPEPTVAPGPASSVNNAAGGAVVAPQESQGAMVWIAGSGNGTKYHRYSGCSNMKNPVEISLSDAQARGYTACKKCYG